MLDIIYEDDSLLVLSKPAGRTVNKAETTQNQVTLQDELEEYFGIKKSEDGIGGRAGIVHRLDKDTSGILAVAKTKQAFEKLQSQFKERLIDKEYLALVHGETPQEGEIDEPIFRHPKMRTRFTVDERGRPSQTSFVRERLYEREEGLYSFIRVHPLTGRTHQIRVHMKHIGHPVVSDPIYLPSSRFKRDLEFCPRLFLHAAALAFVHPSTGARMRFEAELPEDLQRVLVSLATL